MPKKTKRESALQGAWLDNPMLVQAIGLTPAIIATTSLRMAMWVSVVTAVHLLVCEVVASLWLKKMHAWARTAVYFSIGIVLVFGAGMLFSFVGTDLLVLRTILPMLATSSIAAIRCERFAVYNGTRAAVRDALVNAAGFTGVMLIMGFLRELLGHGSLLGIELTETLRIRGFWMPFGGFLLLGFLAAGLKTVLQWMSSRGIARDADQAMEMAPEDRQERLEKIHRLLHAAEQYEAQKADDDSESSYALEQSPAPQAEAEPAPMPFVQSAPPTAAITRELPKLDDLTIEQLLAEFQGGTRHE